MNPQDINEQIKDINQKVSGLNKERGTDLQGLGEIPETVTSKELNAPAVDVPTPSPYTGITGELANIESKTDSFTKDLQTKTEQAQKGEQTSFEELLSQAITSPTESQVQSKLYGKKGGVDDVEKELNDINSQLRAEQQALRRKKEAISTSGLTKTQAQQEIDEVDRQSLRKQADLSVIQQSIQGRFDSAKTIADRAIKAEMEFEQKKLDLAELAYNRNKSLFDKSEQRLFETRQADRQRKLDQEEKNLKEISDLSIKALEDGAPSSIVSAMRGAKTPEEAIRIGGRYIGALDRQTKGLAARKALIDLAKDGDRDAITQLGYDPNKSPADIVSSENAANKVQKDISRVEGLLKNRIGLGVSAGTLQGRLPSVIGSAITGGATGAVAGSVIPGLGTAAGVVGGTVGGALGGFGATTPARQKFLNDIDYLATNLTFDKFRELAEQGVKLTPVSEKELEQIARSSNELATAIRRDSDGNIKGIDLPEQEVVRLLTDIQEKYRRVQNELNIKDAFNMEELNELNNL